MKLLITENGNRYWMNDRKCFHRDNGPAIEYNDGAKEWYKNGKLHRDNGPAVECSDGYREWWLNGKKTGRAMGKFD